MFSELQSLLYQAYTTQDNEHQEHILDIINSMHNQYNFYVTLIQIISSKNIPENICQSACVQMRLSISRFWRNDLNKNIKNLIIQSIPNLLLGFRPSMFSSLLYMTKVLMNLTLYNGEWNNVFDIIVELLNGDSIDRKNGGLLLFLSLVKSALKNKDKLNSKISFKIAKIVQFIPTILCNENDSLFIPGTVDEAFNNNNFVLGVISFKNKASLSTQCTTILKSSTKVETPQIYIVDP